MANWKVSKEKIKLFPHPNADKMQLGRVGVYQVCVQVGQYEDDDVVLFIPEKSLLPDAFAEPYRNYLTGAESNRVRVARLRGELSMGIIFPLGGVEAAAGAEASSVVESAAIGDDVSEALGIAEWIPPVPVELAGQVEPVPYIEHFGAHDVDQMRIFADSFHKGESVVVTEKVHGTQVSITLNSQGVIFITSKGLAKRSLTIVESKTNSYWRAFRNTGIESAMRQMQEDFGANTVQVFGEVVPVQAGYTYGFKEPRVLVFDVRINGVPMPLRRMPSDFLQNWVPILADEVPFDQEVIFEMAQGMEQVSGREHHIREGVVARPMLDRLNQFGEYLMVKAINKQYKDFDSSN